MMNRPRAKHKDKPAGQNRAILVVEDDVGLNLLIRRRLEREGYQADGAGDGAAALEWVAGNQDGPPPLLLLDYLLPDGSCDGLIERMRGRRYHAEFIIMTGQGNEKVAVEMLKLGARDYLTKEADFLDLLPEVVGETFRRIETEERLERVERELRTSEERFRQLAENFRDALVIFDYSSGETQYLNPAAERMFGRNNRELVGLNPTTIIGELIHPHDRDRLTEEFGEAKRRREAENWKGTFKTTFRMVHPEQGERCILQLSYPHRGIADKLGLHYHIFRDITEQRRAEERIAERLRYEEAVAFCSRLLAEEESLERALRRLLGRLLELVEVDRGVICSFPERGGGVEVLAHLDSRNPNAAAPAPTLLGDELTAELEKGRPTLARSGLLEGRNPGEIAGKNPDDSEDGAVLLLPVFSQRRLWGCVVLDPGRFRRWADEDLRLLQTVAEMLGSSLERRQNRLDILESKRRWETTFDTVPDLIFLIDGAGLIYRVNRALCERLGVEYHQLIGRHYSELLFGGPPPENCPVARMLREGREWMAEIELFGGQFLVSSSPMHADGESAGGVTVARDITELKQAQRLIAESEVQYRELSAQLEGVLNAITDRLTYYDKRGNPVWANRAAGEAGERAGTVIARALSSGRLEYEQLRRQDPDSNEERFFDIIAYPIHAGPDEKPRLTGVIELVRDVTDRELRQELRQRQAIIEQIEQIFSTIRHEMGNTLNTLKASLTALSRNIERLSPERRAFYLKLALDTFQVAERLLTSLREYQRLEQLTPRLVVMDEFLEQKGALFRETARGHGIEVLVATGAPGALIRIDNDALFRVLINIFDNALNACKSVDDPRIVLASRLSGRHAIINLIDNGPGIPEDVLAHAFTPLFTTRPEGSGLGLAIVQKLMQQMEGRVQLASVPGAGTTVTLILPLAE